VTKGFRFQLDALEPRTLLAFGLNTTSTSYNVDTGAGVTFSVLRGGSLSNTVHLGDLTSFKLNGVEFSAPYSTTSRYAHFESGLSSLTNMTADVDPAGNWIKITCDDTTATTGSTGVTGVIQYYIARKNDPVIYMATYAPEMLVSSTRFITYLDRTKMPNVPDESDNAGNTGAIESGDVSGFADGTTSSKYYGETRNISHLYHGATGPNAGAFMFIGSRESGAGGPFWKDIDFQSGSAVEIYNMPFSGHSLTDTFRPGLHGPYALVLTNGTPPTSILDYSFLEDAGLTGWVSASARGSLRGRATGVAAGRIATVALSNTEAQYWDTPDAQGKYSITGIKPGAYTETLYDEELAVGTRTVTIAAGESKRADITATAIFGLNGSNNSLTAYNSTATPIWRIGNWDGTPREFLNGDKITIMHPQDARLSPWAADSTGMTNFTIGVNTDRDWPMAEWKTQVGAAPYVDTKNRITFNLTSTQRSQGLTLRIGVTRQDSERPGVSANGGTTQYSSTILTQPDARGLSLGNWRGNNGVYAYSFAANSLNVGTNTFDIYAISGSTFTGYFSGYHIYDAIDLVPTSSSGNPTVTSLSISPGNSTNIGASGSRVFSVVGNSSAGQRPVNAVWSCTRGIINDTGEYVAPSTTGADTVTATLGSVTSSITINVTSTTPTIATPATPANPIVYTNSTTLSVLGADDGGEAALKYTWSTVGTQPGSVTFGAANGTNTAKNISATFSAYGVYTLQATIADAANNTTVTQTKVVVQNERAWYKFDQPNGVELTDHSGNAFAGTIAGAYEFPDGISNDALRLKNGAATLPAGIVSGLDDFTIATWVKPDSLSDWARIFDFGTDTSAYMFLTARAGGTGNLRFAITIGAGEQQVNGPALPIGTWTHLAISLLGSTATLYVNGIPASTNTGVTLRPSSLGTTTRNFLGESQFSADPTFMGAIDDFRIYGRALTPAEVARFSDTTPPLVVSSSFNYETGPSIIVNFNEHVIDSLSASDFTLVNLTTGQTIPTGQLSLTTSGTPATPTVATISISPLLASGNYRLTINGVSDVAGNAMATAVYDFYFLAADGNRDRIVDTQDFNLLAANFGQQSRVFGQGNFSHDTAGLVDSVDFNILILSYATRLVLPGAPVSSPFASPLGASPDRVEI
jgi:rhamnogalacturonan endolyase